MFINPTVGLWILEKVFPKFENAFLHLFDVGILVLGNKSRTHYDFLTETIFILHSPIIKPLSIIFSRFNKSDTKSDKFVEN